MFYYLLRGGSVELLKDLFLLDESGAALSYKSFDYLKNGAENSKLRIIDDGERFGDLGFVLSKILEFTDAEQLAMWKILAAILHIGNATVDGSCFVEGKGNMRISSSSLHNKKKRRGRESCKFAWLHFRRPAERNSLPRKR